MNNAATYDPEVESMVLRMLEGEKVDLSVLTEQQILQVLERVEPETKNGLLRINQQIADLHCHRQKGEALLKAIHRIRSHLTRQQRRPRGGI